MEVYKYLLCSLWIDADQLDHCRALDQGHEMVAAYEVEYGVLPESKEDGQS